MYTDLTFLIADQNIVDIFEIKQNLLSGFKESTFLVCRSKKEFEEKIKWKRPDIIFCDYALPGINALQFCMQTRNNHSVPFVFLTRSLKKELMESALMLNTASGFILKNNLRSLTQLTQKLLASSESLSDLHQNKEAMKDNFFLLNDKMGHLLKSNAQKTKLKACHSEIYTQLQQLY